MNRAIGLVVVGICVILSVGCNDGCKSGDVQCKGEVIQVCNEDQNWETEANCADIEDFGFDLNWTCCVDPEDGELACLPKEDCDDGSRQED